MKKIIEKKWFGIAFAIFWGLYPILTLIYLLVKGGY